MEKKFFFKAQRTSIGAKDLKNKYIFVDIDGTLSEYRFNDHVSAKDGTQNGQTIEEIEHNIFLYSRPLKKIIKKITKAYRKGVGGIWVIGAVISPIEVVDKITWLSKNCKGIEFNCRDWIVAPEYWDTFAEYFKFGSKETSYINKYGFFLKGTKNDFWEWGIKHNFFDLKNTVFIDDVLPYLKYAEEIGIKSYHISSMYD